jgi:hypothetical protein
MEVGSGTGTQPAAVEAGRHVGDGGHHGPGGNNYSRPDGQNVRCCEGSLHSLGKAAEPS